MSLAEAAPITGGDKLSRLDIADDGSRGTATPRAVADVVPSTTDMMGQAGHDKTDTKGKKRALFGFGKKKQLYTTAAEYIPKAQAQSPAQASSLLKKSGTNVPRTNAVPTMVRSRQSSQHEYSFPTPSSPGLALSASPRIVSPAGSQIFERDVQDSTVLKPNSPAIPTHIQTENYIPPVLDDASEAITNNKLDPDTVEIVTHSSHQPASVTVTGATSSSSPNDQSSTEWAAELASFADRIGISGEAASNYGSLDSADVRRLSFISFADVVLSEHGAGGLGRPASRDNMNMHHHHLAGLTTLPPSSSMMMMNRSPSPMRSPVSSQGLGPSPPTSNPGSVKGVELSMSSPSSRKLLMGGSPKSGQHSLMAQPGAGELNIETMRQALRRTASTDLATAPSMPNSPLDSLGSR